MAAQAPPRERPRRPSPAKAHLLLSGYRTADFARYYGCSANHAYQVLNEHTPASFRFRFELARFLGLPQHLLWPEYSANGQSP